MVKDVTPEDIATLTAESKLVFIDCWAAWCGPCMALAPILEELDEKYSDNSDISFVKINTDNHRTFAMDNNITGIPCVLVFFDGEPATFLDPYERGGKRQETDRIIGLRPAEHYEDVIEQLLK